jgi:hypothetical protein
VAKTQYYTPASIDGFIAGPGNWTDWLFQVGIAPVLLGGGTPLLSRRLLTADLSLAKVENDTHFVFLTYTVRGSAP